MDTVIASHVTLALTSLANVVVDIGESFFADKTAANATGDSESEVGELLTARQCVLCSLQCEETEITRTQEKLDIDEYYHYPCVL